MARRRRRRKNTGDQIVLSLILVALVWAFAPGVGWDLLDLRSRLGWPPTRSGQALSTLPDSEAARQLRAYRSFLRRFLRYTGLQPRGLRRGMGGRRPQWLRHTQ